MARKLLLMLLAMAPILIAGCGGGAPQSTPSGPPTQAQSASEGKVVFEQNCNPCHPSGGQGTGPALKGRALPVERIKSQVRNGGGAMPAFPPSRIDDQRLAALAQYVQSLK